MSRTRLKRKRTLEDGCWHTLARLHEKFGLPVYPIVIFTFDAPLTKQSDAYLIAFPDKTVLEFHYHVIQLNHLNWFDFIRRENPVASALMAKMNIAPEDRSRVRLECIRMIAGLKLNKAKMHLLLGFVDTYLRLNADETRAYESELSSLAPVEKEVVMETVMSWQEQWLEEGMREGLEKGREEGKRQMASMLIRQAERRFGHLDPGILTTINELNQDRLNELGGMLLDFERPEDLAKWLGISKN